MKDRQLSRRKKAQLALQNIAAHKSHWWLSGMSVQRTIHTTRSEKKRRGRSTCWKADALGANLDQMSAQSRRSEVCPKQIGIVVWLLFRFLVLWSTALPAVLASSAAQRSAAGCAAVDGVPKRMPYKL